MRLRGEALYGGFSKQLHSFRNLQITSRCVKTNFMLSVCKKSTRILKAYGGAPLNTSGEYLPATTEITKHQNLLSPVRLISTTTKLARLLVVESAINISTQNIVPRGNAN